MGHSQTRHLVNNGTQKSTGKIALDQWERKLIEEQLPYRAVYITAGDIDGDRRKDIISIGWYNPKIWLYENKAKSNNLK